MSEPSKETEIAHAMWRVRNVNFAPPGWPKGWACVHPSEGCTWRERCENLRECHYHRLLVTT